MIVSPAYSLQSAALLASSVVVKGAGSVGKSWTDPNSTTHYLWDFKPFVWPLS